MTNSNLAPLEFVATRHSEAQSSLRSRQNSQLSSNSDLKISKSNSKIRAQQRSQSWFFSNAHLQREDNSMDDFYNGDIYAGINRPFDCFLRTNEEKKEAPGPYLQHVRIISQGWHHLRYLADFMTASTVPLRAMTWDAEGAAKIRQERFNRVNISVIEYGNQLQSKHLRSPEQLDDFLAEVNASEKAPEGRLMVVQDLSTCMIEKLGAAFDVEPFFFRSHIGDYVWLNTRDPQAEIPDLEAFSQKSNFFSVSYVQPRYFPTEESLEKAKKQAESFNVLRRIDHDGRFKSWSDIPGSDVGLVRSKVSLWVKPRNSDKEGWLGILLVDPTITHGFPLWNGHGNFHPTPSIHSSSGNSIFAPSEGGAIQDFMFWTLNQAQSKPNVPPPSADLLPLAFFNMICAQWILMCEYINTRLGQIEYEIELGLSTLYNQDYDHTVKTLLTWRRRMPIYHAFVERAISRLCVRYKSTEPTAPFSSWEDILINLRDILKRLEILHCRADKIMNVSMAVTAREESKDAERKTRAFTRVQYLAFIFVPLGFWTGFFGMSSDIPLNVVCLWAEIALPITACVLAVLLFAGKISGWWRRVREDGLSLRGLKGDMLHQVV